MEVGYCRAYRKAWSHPVFKDLLDAAIWNYLYQNAFYNDGFCTFNGKLYEIKRGQIVTSIRHMATGFRVSERSIKRVVETLVKCKSLSVEMQRRASVITINNYNRYQPLPKQECSTEAEPKQNRSRTGAAPLYKYKNQGIKELRNKEIEGGVITPPAKTKKNIATRLKSDWSLDAEYEAWGDWAVSEFSWSIDKVVSVSERFKDYWVSKSGKDAAKLDWFAVWRNWCRKEQEGF